MSPTKTYVCSSAEGCSDTFTRYADFKKHKATHAPHVYTCRWDGCVFETLMKTSYDIHSAKHTGEQRYNCPHDCDYKTHDPALFTRHRKKNHGYVPLPRGRGAPSAVANGNSSLTSFKPRSKSQLNPQQPQPQPQPNPQQLQPHIYPQGPHPQLPHPNLYPQGPIPIPSYSTPTRIPS
ncbi:hypothetical protein EDB19DRAFT_626758 [Suillus lakei]|nr:hypothetical protein EDB19DRAFT_626758 [Suillus lakei]